MSDKKKELTKDELKQVQGAGWSITGKRAPDREELIEEGEGGREDPFEIEQDPAARRRSKQELPKRI